MLRWPVHVRLCERVFTAWTYTHDAWNRLVKVASGASTISEFKYNGLDWCIVKTSDTDANGSLDQRRFRYYNAEWQLVEERIDDESPFQADPATDIDRHVQYLWGQRYLDDLIAHREDTNTDGTFEETWYHMTDAIFSTVAVLDDAGALVERVTNDSYGDPRHHFFNDVDGDGDGDSSDLTTIQNLDGDVITDATYNVAADIDRDGDIDTDDYNLANVSGTDTALAKGVLSRASVDSQIGFSGHVYNAEVRLYLMRLRCYSPAQGRFIERDPAGYVDGMNLYEYVRGNPLNGMDPYGRNLIPGLVGGLVGGIAGAIIGGLRGGWGGALQEAVAGGIGGFVGGMTLNIGLGLRLWTGIAGALGGAASGAAGGIINEGWDSLFYGDPFEWGAVAEAAGWGALAGLIISILPSLAGMLTDYPGPYGQDMPKWLLGYLAGLFDLAGHDFATLVAILSGKPTAMLLPGPGRRTPPGRRPPPGSAPGPLTAPLGERGGGGGGGGGGGRGSC